MENNNRFNTSVGFHYSSDFLSSLSDAELLRTIDELPIPDYDLYREVCYRLGCLAEYIDVSSDDFEFFIDGVMDTFAQRCKID